jgi:regulator of nonsense transcripts 2
VEALLAEDAMAGLSPSDAMSIFLTDLPRSVNRALIDKLAMDFCQINNKGNRRRLMAALFKVPRTRLDLLPFYARLVATLSSVIPEISSELISNLRGEFHFYTYKLLLDNLDGKLRNIRYLGELTKFKVCQPKEALRCLQILLRRFEYHDIDVACALLDTCGRFLYRSGDTHIRTKILLEILNRKRVALPLDVRQNAMISNAIYYCNPLDNSLAVRKVFFLVFYLVALICMHCVCQVRPPVHEYLRKLLYGDLEKSKVDFVFAKLRLFPWGDAEFVAYAVKCFTRFVSCFFLYPEPTLIYHFLIGCSAWLVKFSSLDSLASVLAGLESLHPKLATAVVDAVLEEVRVGMECNLPTINQRRFATARYLGEVRSSNFF